MKVASFKLSEILIKYKDQQQLQFGEISERMFPVSAVIDIVEEHTAQHTAPLIEALEEIQSYAKSVHIISSLHVTKITETALLNAKGL